MERRIDQMPSRRLDRTGRNLVLVGVVVIAPPIALSVLGAALFISYFADDSAERGLAAMVDVWPAWAVAGAFMTIVMAALIRMVRGGSIALLLGGAGGLLVAVGCLWLLLTGSHEVLRSVVLVAAVAGGLALAAGSAARLIAGRRAVRPLTP